MRPLIGLVCSMDAKEEKFHVKNAYVEAIEKNNGIPILLPPMKNFNLEELGFLDGIFLIGGNDINPLFLGEEPSLHMGETSPIRDVFEFAMLEWAIKNNIPILGICRGMQVMGGFNGKLIQDINSEVKEPICHSQKSFVNIYTHTVTVDENSKLSKVLGTTKIITNSF
ncbi:MAG: gamma-glutamyl-gamma-aminobutyrate hydrolase family protein, partial [Anaerotignaceae bacterium]